jgi:hypothetical protein
MLDTLRPVAHNDYVFGLRTSSTPRGLDADTETPQLLISNPHERKEANMNYDDWKLESPEDEDERLNGPIRRRQARWEYLADQRDEFLEAEQMEKNNDGNA